jgi:Thiamine monophosphate synthase
VTGWLTHPLLPSLCYRRLLLITKKAGVPLIINDRVDVAMAIGAGSTLYHHSSFIHYIPSNRFDRCNVIKIISIYSKHIHFSLSLLFLIDGVHVGQSDMNAAEVRKLIGPYKILGVSTKSCQEVRQHNSYSCTRSKYLSASALYAEEAL